MTITLIGGGTVTATGPVGSGIDISGLTGDYTIEVVVSALSSASGTPAACISLEDSVNAFTATVPVALDAITGPIVSTAPVASERRKYDAPTLRLGTTSAVLRPNVVALTGGSPSLSFNAYLITQ